MKRSEIKEQYKWKIEDIFTSDDEFYKKVKELEPKIDFSSFKGNLNNAQTIKKCYDYLYSLALDLEVLSVYAMMRRDENADDRKANELSGTVDELFIKFSSSASFIDVEITSLSNAELDALISNETLSLYKRDLQRLKDYKPHILSEDCEKLLALGGKVFGGYHDVFSMIDNVDLDVPEIMVDGEKVKVTSATYSLLLQHPSKNVRKKAFKAYYGAYRKLLNTITATYKGNVDKNVFISRVKKFDSCLDRALFNEEVDKCVYTKLLESVNKNLKTLHSYVKYRKGVIGGTLNMYDLYVPLVKDAEIALDYEEAYELVIKGLQPLGSEYASLLKTAKEERWIDVYENEGKRSGAYSVCTYGLKHPYVLLNHTKTTHSVFTIAHELGHALHSYMSNRKQPQTTADYKIFVAEVASTVNEILLIKYLINNEKDVNIKKYLLSYYLDTLRTTLFRQTMFAEFEYLAHNLAERGETLTKELLNEKYLELNKKYYGKSVKSNEEIAYEWARIPHFYTAFYVYKYATGIISAVNIAEAILKDGEPAVQKYFKFLSSGSSNTPVELLKIAGVNLETDEPYNVCMQSFKDALSQLEKI
ncbi:MAG: oligoendopeptidase F [Clostridia bacterium]|nr:oligoendopeptidase F [Clostridia bacterium]